MFLEDLAALFTRHLPMPAEPRAASIAWEATVASLVAMVAARSGSDEPWYPSALPSGQLVTMFSQPTFTSRRVVQQLSPPTGLLPASSTSLSSSVSKSLPSNQSLPVPPYSLSAPAPPARLSLPAPP